MSFPVTKGTYTGNEGSHLDISRTKCCTNRIDNLYYSLYLWISFSSHNYFLMLLY